MFKKLFGEIMRKSLVLSLSMLFAAQVSAQSELAMLLGVLKDNGTITVDQYKRLMAEHQGEKVETQKLSKIKQPIANEAQVVVKNGIKVKSADKQFSAHIGGRVEAHAAWYKSDDFDLGDGTAIRRARLFIKGTLYNDWQYKLDYDFVAGGTKGIKDAFLTTS